MSTAGAKVATRINGGVKHVWYYCPGCKHNHYVPAERWNWNGSESAPTLSPSVRHFIPAMDGRPEETLCHYFVRDGRIEYCGDCPHEFSGKTVEMQEPTNVPDNS